MSSENWADNLNVYMFSLYKAVWPAESSIDFETAKAMLIQAAVTNDVPENSVEDAEHFKLIVDPRTANSIASYEQAVRACYEVTKQFDSI